MSVVDNQVTTAITLCDERVLFHEQEALRFKEFKERLVRGREAAVQTVRDLTNDLNFVDSELRKQ